MSIRLCEKSFGRKLDLLMVNPSLDWKLDSNDKVVNRIENGIPNQETPHIGMAYLLAVAKKNGLNAKYIDMVTDSVTVDDLLGYIAHTTPVLVGFTAYTVKIKAAGIIATQIKHQSPSIIICVGGPHATAIPQQTLDEFTSFDFIVCGEGEHLLPKLVDIMKNRNSLTKLLGVVTREGGEASWCPISDVDNIPFPDWSEFDFAKYLGAYPHRTKLELPIISGRGCPYRCIFCCRALGNTVRLRSVQSVVSEIEHNIREYGCESIAFLDETFVVNKKWSDEFFATMINSGLSKRISWSCSTRVSNASPELLHRMREAGCYYIFFGLESADDSILKMIKKGITVEQIRNAIKWTKEAGIIPVGAFIIGLPSDTEEHVFKAIRLAEELDLYSVTFPIAVPFPGTELRDMALKHMYGMNIISDDWDDYGKQIKGVMESKELPWARRSELQKIAYARNPKKSLVDYMRTLEKMNSNRLSEIRGQ